MRIAVDTHTHSLASGHAYSTIEELARSAALRGLSGLVVTDHGPGIPGGTQAYHFGNLRVLPPRIAGVRVYAGIEANIMDASGRLDLGEFWLGRLDFVMAGLHEICLAPGGAEENLRALLAALESPFVDALSHPDNPAYPVDLRRLARAAKAAGKALELNDSSFRIRTGSAETMRELASACAEEGTFVTVGSDAHYRRDSGRFGEVRRLLRELRFPRELVLNAERGRFEAFVAARKAARAAAAAGLSFAKA